MNITNNLNLTATLEGGGAAPGCTMWMNPVSTVSSYTMWLTASSYLITTVYYYDSSGAKVGQWDLLYIADSPSFGSYAYDSAAFYGMGLIQMYCSPLITYPELVMTTDQTGSASYSLVEELNYPNYADVSYAPAVASWFTTMCATKMAAITGAVSYVPQGLLCSLVPMQYGSLWQTTGSLTAVSSATPTQPVQNLQIGSAIGLLTNLSGTTPVDSLTTADGIIHLNSNPGDLTRTINSTMVVTLPTGASKQMPVLPTNWRPKILAYTLPWDMIYTTDSMINTAIIEGMYNPGVVSDYTAVAPYPTWHPEQGDTNTMLTGYDSLGNALYYRATPTAPGWGLNKIVNQIALISTNTGASTYTESNIPYGADCEPTVPIYYPGSITYVPGSPLDIVTGEVYYQTEAFVNIYGAMYLPFADGSLTDKNEYIFAEAAGFSYQSGSTTGTPSVPAVISAYTTLKVVVNGNLNTQTTVTTGPAMPYKTVTDGPMTPMRADWVNVPYTDVLAITGALSAPFWHRWAAFTFTSPNTGESITWSTENMTPFLNEAEHLEYDFSQLDSLGYVISGSIVIQAGLITLTNNMTVQRSLISMTPSLSSFIPTGGNNVHLVLATTGYCINYARDGSANFTPQPINIATSLDLGRTFSSAVMKDVNVVGSYVGEFGYSGLQLFCFPSGRLYLNGTAESCVDGILEGYVGFTNPVVTDDSSGKSGWRLAATPNGPYMGPVNASSLPLFCLSELGQQGSTQKSNANTQYGNQYWLTQDGETWASGSCQQLHGIIEGQVIAQRGVHTQGFRYSTDCFQNAAATVDIPIPLGLNTFNIKTITTYSSEFACYIGINQASGSVQTFVHGSLSTGLSDWIQGAGIPGLYIYPTGNYGFYDGVAWQNNITVVMQTDQTRLDCFCSQDKGISWTATNYSTDFGYTWKVT